MNTQDIERLLGNVREALSNDEAHTAQDKLYVAVLSAIADGTAENPGDMARLALTVLDIKFERWYS